MCVVNLPSRCYDYWFWVPLVAPPIGGVMGTFMYLIFIEWHLPDPDQPDNDSALSISETIKQPGPTWEKDVELKSSHF